MMGKLGWAVLYGIVSRALSKPLYFTYFIVVFLDMQNINIEKSPMTKSMLSLLVAIGLVGTASAQLATSDNFGTGANQFTLDFTTIGNPGNAADTTGYGSVGYTYRIGTYAISQNQIDAATASGLANVTAGWWSGNQPAGGMSWYESAAFVNWLNTSTGNQAAYKLSHVEGSPSISLWDSFDPGYNSFNQYRNSQAKYFLPSDNEFYKAAYGKSDGSGYYLYPTASDTAPTAVASGTAAQTAVYAQDLETGPASVYEAGGLSSYGTMGQGGNVWQWVETAYGGLTYAGVNGSVHEARVFRGSAWDETANLLQSSTRFDGHPYFDGPFTGFRVASVVPEPSTYALFGLGALALLIAYRRKAA